MSSSSLAIETLIDRLIPSKSNSVTSSSDFKRLNSLKAFLKTLGEPDKTRSLSLTSSNRLLRSSPDQNLFSNSIFNFLFFYKESIFQKLLSKKIKKLITILP
jgi:hypothetical protein